jgi:hypothetical protein
LRLLEEIIDSKSFWTGLLNWIVNRLTVLVYWRARHRFNKTMTSVKLSLLQYRLLAKILKRLKSMLKSCF